MVYPPYDLKENLFKTQQLNQDNKTTKTAFNKKTLKYELKISYYLEFSKNLLNIHNIKIFLIL